MICAAEMTFDKCPSVAVGKAECYPMKKADYCIEHEIIGKTTFIEFYGSEFLTGDIALITD